MDEAAGLSKAFDDALVYAADTHRDQMRKRGYIPYVSHLLIVCGSVLEAGGSETQAIAALLHDAAEDQGGHPRLDDIRVRFGEEVASLVEACSDSLVEGEKTKWLDRKEAHLERLAKEGADVHLVIAADKLANARSMLADVREQGVAAMEIFTGGVKGTLWYMTAMARILHDGPIGGSGLVDEFSRTLEELSELLR